MLTAYLGRWSVVKSRVRKGWNILGGGLQEKRTCLRWRIKKVFMTEMVPELSPEGYVGQME